MATPINTTSEPTGWSGNGVLANYLPIMQYRPSYGDFVVWSGWFNTWYGVVVAWDRERDQLSVIFEGLPYLLFTLSPAEQERNQRRLSLAEIRRSRARFAILQRDRGVDVWYV